MDTGGFRDPPGIGVVGVIRGKFFGVIRADSSRASQNPDDIHRTDGDAAGQG